MEQTNAQLLEHIKSQITPGMHTARGGNVGCLIADRMAIANAVENLTVLVERLVTGNETRDDK